MSDLDRIEIGERVVSLDGEDEGASGEVVGSSVDRLSIRWDDGHVTSAPRGSVRREDQNLTLDQIVDFDLQAQRLTLPLELAQYFEAVCAAAKRDVLLRLSRGAMADAVRAELARTGDEMELRDRVAALVAIFLRDAIVLAGGIDAVIALDDLAVRAEFLEAAAQLTETAMLAPILADSLDGESNVQIRAAIGKALIDAAAAKVIDAHRAYGRIERELSRLPTVRS